MANGVPQTGLIGFEEALATGQAGRETALLSGQLGAETAFRRGEEKALGQLGTGFDQATGFISGGEQLARGDIQAGAQGQQVQSALAGLLGPEAQAQAFQQFYGGQHRVSRLSSDPRHVGVEKLFHESHL